MRSAIYFLIGFMVVSSVFLLWGISTAATFPEDAVCEESWNYKGDTTDYGSPAVWASQGWEASNGMYRPVGNELTQRMRYESVYTYWIDDQGNKYTTGIYPATKQNADVSNVPGTTVSGTLTAHVSSNPISEWECPVPECEEGISLGGKTVASGLAPTSMCIDQCEYVSDNIDPITLSYKNEQDEWVTDFYGVISTGEPCPAESVGATNDPTAEQPPEMVGAPYPLTKDAEGNITGDNDRDGIPNSIDSDIDGDGTSNADDQDVDGDGEPNISDNDVDSDGVSNGGQDGMATNPRTYIFNNPSNDPTGAAADPDVDGDGDANGWDPDVDGDGYPNSNDADIDGDGIANGPDIDSDGDGQLDGIDSDSDGDGILDENDPDPDGSSNDQPEEYGEATIPELPGTPEGEGSDFTFQPLIDVKDEMLSKAPFNVVSDMTEAFTQLQTSAVTPNFTVDLGMVEAEFDFTWMDSTASMFRSVLSFFMYLFTGVMIVRVFMER